MCGGPDDGGADLRSKPNGGGGAVQHGEGPMVVDSEDMGATVIAVVTRRLINPCPGFAMGIRTMVVVTVQGAPRGWGFCMGRCSPSIPKWVTYTRRRGNVCHQPQPLQNLVLNTYSNSRQSDMSCLSRFTCFLRSTGQGVIPESQRQWYASFSCCAYQLVSKHCPRVTVHKLCRICRSTSSTMIHSLKYFISVDRPSLTKMSILISVSEVGRDGNARDGGTSSHKFAKDGGT